MNHISLLKKKKNKCLIVGNGPSSAYLDLSKFKDYDIWSCNDALWNKADYIVYYDKKMQNYFSLRKLKKDQILIGYKHANIDHTVPRCNYFYTFADMVFGDTGLHALQFADRLGYEKIYLIGYDYNCDINSYHYKEKDSDREKLVRFLKASITTIQKYFTIDWISDILILSTSTLLQRFDIGDINHV